MLATAEWAQVEVRYPVKTGCMAFGDAAKPVSSDELPPSLGKPVLAACAAPMIIFEIRARDCLLRYVNPAFARQTGYSTDEIARNG